MKSGISLSWSLYSLLPHLGFIEILDVGAALNGAPPYQPLVNASKARVTGFEPDADQCRKLNELYGSTHRFYPHFIGDGHRAVFHQTSWALTGSLLEPNTPLLKKFTNLHKVTTLIARHEVDTVRLDDVTNLPAIDFFKIDIQGGELAVFENGRKVLSSVLAIWTEVEFVQLYRNQPLFGDVDRFLRQEGFQFYGFADMGRCAFDPFALGRDSIGIGQLLWSDAIYVRDWMHLERLESPRLAKFAVISHDILRSSDLAHFLLSEIDRRERSDLALRYRDALRDAKP